MKAARALGRRRADDTVDAAATDAPVHDEFEERMSPPAAAGEDLRVESEGPRGSRDRNAAMVGAGGLACAAAGALLGGIGGSFTIAPAATHSVASTSGEGSPAAAGASGGTATASGTGGGR